MSGSLTYNNIGTEFGNYWRFSLDPLPNTAIDVVLVLEVFLIELGTMLGRVVVARDHTVPVAQVLLHQFVDLGFSNKIGIGLSARKTATLPRI